MRKSAKKKWQLAYKGKMEEFDNDCSLRFWAKQSPSVKFAEVSSLINQYLAIKGKKNNGSELLRSTAIIKRI